MLINYIYDSFLEIWNCLSYSKNYMHLSSLSIKWSYDESAELAIIVQFWKKSSLIKVYDLALYPEINGKLESINIKWILN